MFWQNVEAVVTFEGIPTDVDLFKMNFTSFSLRNAISSQGYGVKMVELLTDPQTALYTGFGEIQFKKVEEARRFTNEVAEFTLIGITLRIIQFTTLAKE